MFSVLIARPWLRRFACAAWLSLCLAWGANRPVGAAEMPPVSERVRIACTQSMADEKREEAILSLTAITEKEEADNNVGEKLVAIAANTKEDLFIRIDAVETLGKLEINVIHDGKIKNLFRKSFIAILGDPAEHMQLRKKVAEIFKATLKLNPPLPDLQDRDQAFPVLVKVAKDRKEPPMLRVVCIEAIGELSVEEGIKNLPDLLNDPEQAIKEAAVKALHAVFNKTDNPDLSLPTINKLIAILRPENKDFGADIKVVVMKALAKLIRDGSLRVQREEIQKIIKDAAKPGWSGFKGVESDDVVKAAVESMGIIGTPEFVESLRGVYKDYYDEKKVTEKDQVTVRQTVLNALGSVVRYQVRQRAPDLRSVHSVAEQLIWTVDNDSEVSLKATAIYWMKYFYSPAFKAEHKELAKNLLGVLMSKEASDEMKGKACDSLSFISGQAFPPGDLKHWKNWFDNLK